MSSTQLKGTPVELHGHFPQPGETAPDFSLVKTDLSKISLEDFAGRKLVLNIFPSIDTPTCATSVRRFNEAASALANVTVLCVSRDLPFAHARFCGSEGLQNVTSASEFASTTFSSDYGVLITNSVLAGLMARAVLVIDEQGQVIYSEMVSEIANEPDYAAALAVL